MKTNGFFVTRDEIKERLRAEWTNYNYWQRRYINAANQPCKADADTNTPRINTANTAKARAIRAGHRANATAEALMIWAGINVTVHRDYDTHRAPEDFHPVTSLEIKWTPEEAEQLEVIT